MEAKVKNADPAEFIPFKRGFKIVNSRLQGRNGFQYTVGETATETGPLHICRQGLHFCERALDCLDYCTELAPPYRYLRVVSISEPITDLGKSATLKLFIESEMSGVEWLAQAQKECRPGSARTRDLSALLAIGAAEGDTKIMEFALSSGKASSRLDRTNSLYHEEAAASGRVDSMKFLSLHGFGNLGGAISAALRNGHLHVIQFLRRRDDVLPEVARYGSLELAKTVIDETKSNLDVLNQALQAAACMNRLPMVKYLIERGATAIEDAACQSLHHAEIVKYLMGLRAPLNQSSNELVLKFNFEKAKALSKQLGLIGMAQYFTAMEDNTEE